MDPDKAARIMRDPAEDRAVRLEAAEHLLDWLNRGFYFPAPWEHHEYPMQAALDECYAYIGWLDATEEA